jgi:hypothetical protein
MEIKKPALSWSSLFLVTSLAAYLFIFNEWLFAITKPSYLANLGFTQQLQILFFISALLAGLCCLCLIPLVVLTLVPPYKKYPEMMIKLGTMLPAAIFSILILMLIDNFTYTLFKFGIVSTNGWLRALYGLGFFLMIFLCYFRINKALISISHKTKAWGLSPKLTVYCCSAISQTNQSIIAQNSRRCRRTASPYSLGYQRWCRRYPYIGLWL